MGYAPALPVRVANQYGFLNINKQKTIKTNINMTKQNVIDNVQASLGSLFTKEDVIACINSIEQPAPPPATDYITLLRIVHDRVHDMALQFEWDDKSGVDLHDLEFSVFNGNRIQLEEYGIDATTLKDNFLYELGILYNDLKVEHEQRVEIFTNTNQ